MVGITNQTWLVVSSLPSSKKYKTHAGAAVDQRDNMNS